MERRTFINDRGQLHRVDGPAIEWLNGDKHWYIAGKLHRADGPAVEMANGDKYWFVNGYREGLNGFPAVEYSNGTKLWYKSGKQHREGGLPAVEWGNGEKAWCINGRQLSDAKGVAYAVFCEKVKEKKLIRAQKKIYFWWIQICYDMEHPSGCGQRMADRNLAVYQSMVNGN